MSLIYTFSGCSFKLLNKFLYYIPSLFYFLTSATFANLLFSFPNFLFSSIKKSSTDANFIFPISISSNKFSFYISADIFSIYISAQYTSIVKIIDGGLNFYFSFFILFYFVFFLFFSFLFLEQLGLGFISHTVTSVTSWWHSHKTDHGTWEDEVEGSRIK